MLPLKNHLTQLERIPNPDESRLEYLRLDKNENIIPLPPKILSEFKKVLTSNFVSAYPEPGTFYKKLAKYVGCSPKNLYLSSGSDGAIKSVFETFVGPGERVLLVGPTYAMFYVYAKMFEANLYEVRYAPDLLLSVNEIIFRIKSLTPRLVCIANPNSPTGTIIEPDELAKIIELSCSHGAVVLIDEAYYHFYEKTCAPLIKRFSKLVVTRTFSKAFGLASARIGFAIGSPEMIFALHKTRPMYETNAFAVKFAEILLDQMASVKKVLAQALSGKKYLESELRRLKIPFFKSYANFINIDLGSNQKACLAARALKEKSILVKPPFNFPPLDRCIRVNTGSPAQMKMFLKGLNQVK